MNTNDKQYWLNLAERYFDAMTTDEEEQQLKQFVASSDDPAFDEVRAVMGYSVVAARSSAPRIQRQNISVTPYRRALRYAAALLVLAGVGLSVKVLVNAQSAEDQCLAYVNGKRVSDEAVILAMMNTTTHEVMSADEAIATELLQDMFSTMAQ